MKRVAKKIFLYTSLTLGGLLLALVISTVLYKDEIINHFVREANNYINTPVEVEKIDVSIFDNFPEISISLNHVVIEESYEKSSYPLLEAAKLEFTFSPWQLIKGNYTINKVYIIDADCHMKIDKNGKPNYTIFKENNSDSDDKVAFDLSEIVLINTKYRYSSERSSLFIALETSKTLARLSSEGTKYDIQASGDYQFHNLLFGTQDWIVDKTISVETQLMYDDTNKFLSIKPSKLRVEHSDFLVFGDYGFKDTPHIDLHAEGQKTTIRDILAMWPDYNQSGLKQYNSKGDVFFDLQLKGDITSTVSPSLTVNFGLNNAEVFHTETDVTIKKAKAEGTFQIENLKKVESANIKLSKMSGMLEDHPFKGELIYSNFKDPFMRLNFEGKLDANSLSKFYNSSKIAEMSGAINANVNFEGKLNDLKRKNGLEKVKTSGEINMDNIFIQLTNYKLPVNKLGGQLLFNNNDLALNDVSGLLGSSDFELNGFFRNIIAYIVFDDEPVGINSELTSDFINMDELLAMDSVGLEEDESIYGLRISEKLRLQFNCKVKNLQFRRFHGKNIRGNLKIKDQVALTERLVFNSMGGQIQLSGLVNAQNINDIKLNTSFSLRQINIDSIFYVFEDFNQDFLKHNHLKGRIQAEVNARMDFNKDLSLYAETLKSTISTSIIGGELNNFEPMQRLAKYVDEDKLDHLTFSELKNDILIENKKIYLPQMTVLSNVNEIEINGTHTFSQDIDYRVIAPLRNNRKIDKDEAFGAIEEDNLGRTKLYLKIIGTTDDYRVVYDKEGVRKKISKDIKKEINELKDAFKNKGLKKGENR